MLPIVLRDKCQAVAVASVDKNKEQRRLSDELKKDLKQICKDFDILPLQIYMDALVKHFKNELLLIADGWTTKWTMRPPTG